MWISRTEWRSLMNRIEALERKPSPVPSLAINKYPYSSSVLGWSNSWYEYPLTDAVRAILRHLGLELTYHSGTPETVSLDKASKPKA